MSYTYPSKCIYEKSFFFSQSDVLTCADPNKTVNCAENWHWKDCGQIHNSKYKNYECLYEDSRTADFFYCSNRNDKVDILFKNPPVSKQRSYQAVNYNEVLTFNNESFFCGQQEISWADFGDHWNSNEKCLLKNGDNETIIRLWGDLIRDYSFNMSHKLTEL